MADLQVENISDVTFKQYYGLMMGVLGILCISGYGLIALALRGRPDIKKKNYFLVSLGFSDALITVHVFTCTCAAFSPKWPFGDLGCQLDAICGMAFTFVTISNIAWIARDKYLQAYNAIRWRESYTFYAARIWLFGIIAGVLPLLGFGKYGFETDDPTLRTGCLLDFKSISMKYVIYIICISIFWFIMPIYKVFWYYKKVADCGKSTLPLQYIVPVQMIIALTPYAIYAYVSITIGITEVTPYFPAINNVAAKILIATNPYLYIWSDPELLMACRAAVGGKLKTDRLKE